jgi:hypothetical protein
MKPLLLFSLLAMMACGPRPKLITTYRLAPPNDTCILSEEYFWDHTTAKGNTGYFLWECEERPQ